ncbi:MAG TPA: ACT domain-containing protein [Chitinophagaceae bacterium]|nr:ACT domain-containing protein [Chitinophagaceae bacterium]
MQQGETNLDKLLSTTKPKHNTGDFVFCTIDDLSKINFTDIISIFKEEEGFTIILAKQTADKLKLNYSFIAGWITLTAHSSLQAVGFTAAFSKALSENGIGCNVVSAFYHDHLFVESKDINKAMEILNKLSG